MTTIDRLKIQGIRAFNPANTNAGVLEFEKPLTIIVGHNGAGKTTIIEALNYVCTGDLPPGAGKGEKFVNNPESAGQKEVKAQVKLRFKTPNGCQVVVTRNMQVQKKGQTSSFKTLDSTIQLEQPDGTKTSSSKRCADIDKQVPLLMGVSKPILQYVIFCHQNESNWPLEGTDTDLKKRFDLIFSADRYRKALEEIKHQQKELNAQIKVMEPELATIQTKKSFIVQRKKEADAKQEGLEEGRAALEREAEKRASCETKVARVQEELSRVQAVGQSLARLEAVLVEVENRVKAHSAEVERDLLDSDDELRRQKLQWDAQTEVLKEQLKEKQDALLPLLSEKAACESDLRGAQDEVASRRGALDASRKMREKQQQAKDTLMQRWNVPDEAQCAAKIEEREVELRKQSDAYSLKKGKLEQEVRDALSVHAVLEAERNSLEKQLSEAQAELKSLQAEISRKRKLGGELVQLDGKLAKAQVELKKVRETDPSSSLDEDLRQLANQKGELESRKASLLQSLTAAASKIGQVERAKGLRKNATAKEQEYSKALREAEPLLLRALHRKQLSAIPELPNLLKEAFDRCVIDSEQLTKLLEERTARRAALDGSLKSLQRERATHAQRATELRQQLGSRSETHVPLREQVQLVQEEVERQHQTVAELRAVGTLYGKFTAHARERGECMVCERSFSNPAEFRARLEKKIESAAQSLKPAEDEEREASLVLETVRAFLPLEEELQRCNSAIERIDKELLATEPELKRLNEEIPSMRAQLKDSKDSTNKAHQLQSTAANLVRLYHEHARAVADAGVAEDALGRVAGGGRSIEDIEAELKQVQAQDTQLGNAIHSKQADRDAARAEVQALEEIVSDLMQKVMDATTSEQSAAALLERANKLEASVANIGTKKAQNAASIQESTRQKDLSQKQVEQLKSSEEPRLKELEQSLLQFKTDVAALGGPLQSTDDLNQALQLAQKRAATSTERLHAIDERVRAAQEMVTQQERRVHTGSGERRNLDAVLRMREAKAQLAAHTSELNQKRAELASAGRDETKVKADLAASMAELQHLSERIATLKGKMDALLAQKKECERAIRDQNPKQVEADLCNKMLDLEVTRLAIKDLDEYYKALDEALMKYHSDKMTEINVIIRDLWQSTYRGNDIDTIEIRADTEKKAGRTHNYRVVMLKGDTVMEMRGRCSKGQMMLASLIIRLALAETFAVNCGILALDEPTTNLDRANIESLAVALSSILATRRHQAGFQLIVITHDEEFVQMLGKSDYADHYYLVAKDDQGYSTLTRKDTIDLG